MALSDLLYEALGFFAEDDISGDLKAFLETLSAPQEDIYELVREGDDGSAGWSLLFDVNNCPASVLPYLAQYVGVVITDEMTEAQIRAEIAKPTGWERGQEPTIAIAIRRSLTGTEWVSVRPNKPTLGTTYVRTLATETPSPARTAAIVRAVVPAWMLVDYEAVEGVTWADIEAGKYETFTALEGAFKDFNALEAVLISEL